MPSSSRAQKHLLLDVSSALFTSLVTSYLRDRRHWKKKKKIKLRSGRQHDVLFNHFNTWPMSARSSHLNQFYFILPFRFLFCRTVPRDFRITSGYCLIYFWSDELLWIRSPSLIESFSKEEERKKNVIQYSCLIWNYIRVFLRSGQKSELPQNQTKIVMSRKEALR